MQAGLWIQSHCAPGSEQAPLQQWASFPSKALVDRRREPGALMVSLQAPGPGADIVPGPHYGREPLSAAFASHHPDPFLELHMYMTSALGKNDMKAIGLQMALDLLAKKEKKDSITGLQTRTQPGRPDWNKVKASDSPTACRDHWGREPKAVAGRLRTSS